MSRTPQFTRQEVSELIVAINHVTYMYAGDGLIVEIRILEEAKEKLKRLLPTEEPRATRAYMIYLMNAWSRAGIDGWYKQYYVSRA